MRQLAGLLCFSLVSACANDALTGSGGGLPGPTVDANGNHYPEVVAFACTPSSGFAPLTSECQWEIRDQEGDDISCMLDVGADGVAEVTQPTCPLRMATPVTIPNVGLNTVRLFLTDTRGASVSRDLQITLEQSPNNVPVISEFTVSPTTGGNPLPVTFTFGVTDLDGDVTTCRITEGDQVILAATTCVANESRTGSIMGVGMHTLTLEAQDPKGGRVTKTATVTVTAAPAVGDLRISKVEWGQTVISESPKLVANKDALLRVYVLAEKAGVTGVTVKVTGTSGGNTLGDVTLTGPAAAPTADAPADLTQQWRTVIPAAWVTNGLSLSIKVDPANALAETNETNNERVVTPTVGVGNVPAITNVPIVQSGRTGTIRNIEQAMKQIWPVKSIATTTRAAYTFSGTIGPTAGWDALLDQLATVRQSDGSRRNYLGWISVTFGSGVAGIGYVGIGTALTRDDEISTSIHELGHNMGREHAPCGGASGSDRNYPVANAKLDVQGYDFVSGKLLTASQNFDVMSYCDPIWVSAYNYKAVQTWLEARPVSSSAPLTSQPRIVVSGRFNHGTLKLNPVNLIAGTDAPAEFEPGEYTLTLVGERTATVSFGLNKVVDGDDDGHFSLVLPDVGNLSALELSRGDTVLARQFAGVAKAPQATVKNVPGGIEVGWNAGDFKFASVSHLGVDTRTTLQLWAEGGKTFVSTQGLEEAGGEWEVSLSDGVQSRRAVLAR